uniref:Uncharacterized protein n=1 Tax=Panagrolaimus sp. ES5 TaxID=591445 RepID=A0AC34GVW8_9BILA
MSKLNLVKSIDPEIDKEILQINADCDIFKLLSLSRTENGYVVKKFRKIPKNFDAEVLLDSTNPSKILISKACPCANVEELKSNLSAWNPIIMEEHASVFDALKEMVDHIVGLESGKKYFVIPQCRVEYGITAVNLNPNEDDIFLPIKGYTNLPFTESCVVSRFDKKFYITTKYKTNFNVLQKPHEITKEGHRIKLILSVDINNMPTLNHEGVLLSRVKNMPKKLKVEKTEMLPIIGFFDYASVICLWNDENNCYEFLDSWNGKFGKDLFLDFMFPKPKFVDSSTKVTSLSAAVYDLIKIMSMPPDDIKVDLKWKFTFTKDEDHPVLLEFYSLDGSQTHASPTYLMARILNEHIRAIKKATGKKPSKLGCRLLDEFESAEARKRVEAGLEQACKLIEIGFLLV